jgi:hypothetical protein
MNETEGYGSMPNHQETRDCAKGRRNPGAANP